MKNCFIKLYKDFKNTDKPGKQDWILYSIIAIFLFVCFVYWDIYATTSHSINFIEVILKGRILDFYKINYNFAINGVSSMVCYDLPIYPIFMIWNFPLYILRNVFNVDIVNNFFCILWMKGLSVVFLGLSSVVIKKICEHVNIEKKYIHWVILILYRHRLYFLLRSF